MRKNLKKEADWFRSLQDEGKGNAIVLIFIIVGILAQLFCTLLGRFDIFVIDYPIGFAIPGLIMLAPILILLIRDRSVIEKSWMKYYLLAVVLVTIGLLCTKLFFHTTLLMVIPMVLMGCYRSKKMSILCGIGTAILVIATPILAYKFNLMDKLYTAWYTFINDPTYISAKGQELIRTGVPLPATPGLFVFAVVPRLVTLVCFFVLSFCGSFLSRRSYEKKVENILRIQNNALDAMAEIIENRDVSTGGHVKRSRYVVACLTKYAKETFDKPKDYWENVIKSATMHDFGKIAISDAILQKPKKLTEEEFAKIKEHPEKSVEIIKKVLGNIEDEELLAVAENLARYHHEKYDGSGYPAGLAGDEIPLEARIMAVADVWDALVSKRCYKDALSFDEAHKIIIDSMGTHFDPKMLPVFEKAYPEIVALYSEPEQG